MWTLARSIPKSMRDPGRRPDDEDKSFTCWKPLPSSVSKKDLRKLAAFLDRPLPPSYRYFLQQWHFVEIYMDQGNVKFFPNLPGKLTSKFRKIINKYYGYDKLPGRGFLPIADYGDWGVVCFDARQAAPDSDYPVVVLDHDDGYTDPLSYTANFLEMFERERDGCAWMGDGWKQFPDGSQ